MFDKTLTKDVVKVSAGATFGFALAGMEIGFSPLRGGERPQGDRAGVPATFVIVIEKDTEWGLPKRLGVYEIAEAQRVGQEYRAAVLPLKEVGLRMARSTFGPRAATRQDARDLAVQGLRRVAERMNLQVQVRRQ